MEVAVRGRGSGSNFTFLSPFLKDFIMIISENLQSNISVDFSSEQLKITKALTETEVKGENHQNSKDALSCRFEVSQTELCDAFMSKEEQKKKKAGNLYWKGWDFQQREGTG